MGTPPTVKLGRRPLRATEPVCMRPPNRTPSPNARSSLPAAHPARTAAAPVITVLPITEEVSDPREDSMPDAIVGMNLAAATPTSPPPISLRDAVDASEEPNRDGFLRRP